MNIIEKISVYSSGENMSTVSIRLDKCLFNYNMNYCKKKSNLTEVKSMAQLHKSINLMNHEKQEISLHYLIKFNANNLI